MTTIAIVLGCVLILILMISYIAAYKTLHKERQPILKTPSDYGLPYEDIEFYSPENHKLKGWWIPGDSDKLIIVAHGYASNRAGWVGTDKDGVEHYLDWLGAAPALVNAGYNMLYFDMRASGESEGGLITLSKLEAGDFLSAVKWNLDVKGKRQIGILGFSMGANVALRATVDLVNMQNEKLIDDLAVIAIGPYKYSTMVSKSLQYWTALPAFFTPLIKFFAKIILGFNPSVEINPENYINKISSAPILFIQSENDEIGDVQDVISIYEKHKGAKELIVIPNAKRFVHYNYPKNNVDKLIQFYSKYLK